MLVRTLQMLLVVALALSISGLSSAIAAAADEQCCAGEAEATEGSEPDEDQDCPPFCHACACSQVFAIPSVIHERAVISISELGAVSMFWPPTSPPIGGVFHPPRCSA